jgi:hypothetical protein
MSYKEQKYIWTPYGNRWELYQPPDEYMHKECYEKLNDKRKKLIDETAWIKPWLTTGTG